MKRFLAIMLVLFCGFAIVTQPVPAAHATVVIVGGIVSAFGSIATFLGAL